MHLKTDQHELHLRYFKERSKCRNNLIAERFGQPVVEYIAGFVDMSSPEVTGSLREETVSDRFCLLLEGCI